MNADKRVVRRIRQLRQQTHQIRGAKGSLKLRKLAKDAGWREGSGGKHYVYTKAGRRTFTIPRSIKKSWTVDAILDLIEEDYPA